jgi:NAD-dependent dihydropyrimidine dehydrogenase PreA subunit
VSPKAIFTRNEFRPVRLDGELRLQKMRGNRLLYEGPALPAERFATGDYYVTISDRQGLSPARITEIGSNGISLTNNPWVEAAAAGERLTLLVRLQLPVVDPARCIGCGVCEHECPIKGRRAIRVTAENESREGRHRLVL